MAIRDFVFPHAHTAFPDVHTAAAALAGKPGKRTGKTVSIDASAVKPLRKSRVAAKLPACGWYEAEDRTLPSVSSF